MKLWITILCSLVLFGCVPPGPPGEALAQYAQRVCAATQTSPEIREEFMRRCVAMEMGTGPGPAMPSYAPMYPPTIQQGSPYGPDAFGPYGNRGPTWEAFRDSFQNAPPPSPSTMGQADAFGPYGYRGPTWEAFRDSYQNAPPRR